MKLRILILILLLVPFTVASMDVDITISKNNIVTEDFTVYINANQSYDSFEFSSLEKPLSVIYEGRYNIELQDNYIIRFEKNILPGENVLEFSLLYDTLVERNGKNRVFRTSLSSDDDINLKVTLPEKFILSKEPSATPSPYKTTVENQKITLFWNFDQEAVIAIFYEGKENNPIFFFVALFLVMLTVAISFLYSKYKVREIIEETLSDDEKLVVEELRKGTTKQKDIAKNLYYSKSKMSKIIRKLEEKDLVEKKPYFKTNIIKLKKIN